MRSLMMKLSQATSWSLPWFGGQRSIEGGPLSNGCIHKWRSYSRNPKRLFPSFKIAFLPLFNYC